MRTPVKCGYCCTGKYEYGGAPCYGTFECSGLALWYRSPPLLRVLRLLQALGNTVLVCSPLSLVAQASPVFTGICGGDHAGDDTSSYGYSRPLIISTDLWGVSNFQQGRDFANRRPRGCQLIGSLRMGRARLGREVPGLALDHSIATVLFDAGRGSTQRPHFRDRHWSPSLFLA